MCLCEACDLLVTPVLVDVFSSVLEVSKICVVFGHFGAAAQWTVHERIIVSGAHEAHAGCKRLLDLDCVLFDSV